VVRERRTTWDNLLNRREKGDSKKSEEEMKLQSSLSPYCFVSSFCPIRTCPLQISSLTF
jgi:hypothetical protein